MYRGLAGDNMWIPSQLKKKKTFFLILLKVPLIFKMNWNPMDHQRVLHIYINPPVLQLIKYFYVPREVSPVSKLFYKLY